ncbi:MAG TPA: hypothetical protein VGV59_13700 [Pyrinomonadaceae bacterium]|nr:hypothetical protein [Pyrinomonadaceae bacterium]
MKRFLIALLLLLAACSVAVPQNRRMRNRDRRPAAARQASTRNMAGVNIRGNTVRFNSEWQVVKGADGKTYARKKKVTTVVLAVSCQCAQEGPRGTCFLQSIPGRNDALECNKSFDCTGTCGVVTKWVEPKEIEGIGLP